MQRQLLEGPLALSGAQGLLADGPHLLLERLRLLPVLAAVHALRFALAVVRHASVRSMHYSLLLLLIMSLRASFGSVGRWEDLPGRYVALERLVVLVLPFANVLAKSLVLVIDGR